MNLAMGWYIHPYRFHVRFGDFVAIMDISSSEQLKVLVVDDDELNQRMMNLVLTHEGHQVHIACDGADALQAAQSHEFDIILMDLQMPVMDGVEASRKIRASVNGSRNAYIVALTASYLPEKGQELFEAGIDNYIAKPFDVEHLRQMLEYGLDHRKSRMGAARPAPVGTPIPGLPQGLDTRAGIKLVGGDEEIYRELLADFMDKLPEKMRNIEIYFAEKDLKKLAQAAHNVKGVSANLGALQLSEHANRLEKSVGDGYTGDQLQNIVLEFNEVSRRFIIIAADFLADAAGDIQTQ